MGLMGNNPYYSGNPWAMALDSGMAAWNSEEDRQLAKQKQAADIANAESIRSQQQQMIDMQMQSAKQKQDEYAMSQKAQGDFQQRISPRQLVDAGGIPTTLGEGLLPPEFNGQASDPAWGETLAAMQGRKELPALPLSPIEQAGYASRLGKEGSHVMETYQKATADKPMNPLYVKMIEAAQAGALNEQGKAMLNAAGYGQFIQKPDKTDNSHNVQTLPSPDGKTEQKFQYNPTTRRYDIPMGEPYAVKSQVMKINTGDGNPVAQSTFVDPRTGMPLVFDKKAGTYRVASIQGGGGVTGKPTALSPEAATKVEMLDTTIRLVPEIRRQMFDAKGNIDWLDVANAQTKTWGTKGRKIATDINQAVEQVLRVESGAAVPEQEVVRAAARFKPQIGDTKEIVLSKMNNLEKFVQGARDKFNVGRSPQAQGNEVIQRVPPKTMTSLPPASEHAGRTVIGSDGIKRKSNGSKWELVR